MAFQRWATIGKRQCECIGIEVEWLEQRLYQDEGIAEPVTYQVIGRKCTADIACNMAGIPCQMAYTNPNSQPFQSYRR